MHNKIKVLRINTLDSTGGAARSTWNLFRACQNKWGDSWLLVGTKKSDDKNVIQFPEYDEKNIWEKFCFNCSQFSKKYSGKIVGAGYLTHQLRLLGRPYHFSERFLGHEDFEYSMTWKLFDLIPESPDIIHCHNLHGGYFDLRALPWLSERKPVVVTLHDAWLLSGHCAHSFACERWQSGCGNCPDLTIYPSIRRDGTGYNWKRKKEIFSKSRLYISTPSHWLMDKVKKSILAPAIIEAKVIHNSVDVNIFHPFNKQKARQELGLSHDSTIILFAAYGIRDNIWKDYQTMQSAIAQVSYYYPKKDLVFLALGESAPQEKIGDAIVHFVPYQSDIGKVARYYQAADIYIHAARAEVWGNTITEAMSCGIPVVASAVGGIPEQIIDNETGFLTPLGDAQSMAEKIRLLIEDENLRSTMGEKGFDSVQEKFSLEKQADEYLNWYDTILNG